MNTKRVVTIAVIGAALFLEQASAQPADYVVFDLGTLGGGSSEAFGINASGQVVGYAKTSAGETHAFLYGNGVMQDLGTFGGSYSAAYGINNQGQIVGESANSSSDLHAFLYSGGAIHDLGTLGGPQSSATAINNNGQVVGNADISVSEDQAFIYANGTMTALGFIEPAAINDQGAIVGYFAVGTEIHAYLKSSGVVRDLGTWGGTSSQAYGINANGQVVGYASMSSGEGHAFLYVNGAMQDLGILPGRPPSSANAINNNSEVVGRSGVLIGGNGTMHAFHYANGAMQDLNDVVINNGMGWTLRSATAINDKGQIVGYGLNPAGQTHAFLLNPLPLGWRNAMETTLPQPTYSTAPSRDQIKDSLVLITHGRIPSGDSPEFSTAWVDSMSNSVAAYLDANSLGNWKVRGYKWIEAAQTTRAQALADVVVRRAEAEGENLGNCLATQNWSHIHFIAHSAGAALIQAAAEKVTLNVLNGTYIHTTFLDADVGTIYGGRSKYGNWANWSDSYFCLDHDTFNQGAITVTSGPLDHAYNVDVTYLDIHKLPVQGFVSSPGGTIVQCYRTDSTHGWPIDFYANTIPPSTQIGSESLGFPVSKEGGGWNTAMSLSSQRGNDPRKLGTPDPTCIQTPDSAPTTEQPRDLSKLTVTGNPRDGFTIDGYRLVVTPHSPAWAALVTPVTNAINFVSFQSQFIGTTNDSQGLLSILWDTNVIGNVDERVVLPGLRQYTLGFPRASTNSIHMLGFRIDPYSSSESSVMITNVTFGSAGINEAFSLSFVGNTNGLRMMQLNGPAGYTYTVEASTNLVDWSFMALLANTNGTVRFFDEGSSKHTGKVLPCNWTLTRRRNCYCSFGLFFFEKP